ncbi:MAG TPA: hypothetical protein VH741_02230 [Candidatus Limnocylindrales bacterium]|jgi:hypothetical protein
MSRTAERAPVSAVITTFNDAQFLTDALTSVAAQTVLRGAFRLRQARRHRSAGASSRLS